MDNGKLILVVEKALSELEKISGTSAYFRADGKPIVSIRMVLLLLKEEIINNPERINPRVLRAMHDVGMSSYKDFEHTPVEKALNNVTDILYDEFPGYKSLSPLGIDFGKKVPYLNI